MFHDKRVLAGIGLLFSLGIVFFFPTEGGAGDFLQYWAGIKVFLSGQNPYDQNILFAVEREVGSLPNAPFEGITLWNPPFIFPFLLPFSVLSLSYAATLWLFLCLTILVLAVFLLSGGIAPSLATRGERIVVGGAVALFTPTLETVGLGQSSFFLLFSVALYFWARRKELFFIAGLSLSISLIKPHVLLLFLFCVFMERGPRRLTTVLGFLTGASFLAGLPILVQPRIWEWYFNHMKTPPYFWKTPTLGSALQGIVLASNTSLPIGMVRHVPLLCSLVVGVALWWRRQEPFSEHVLLTVVCWSLWVSPYGWGFDQLALLPVVLSLLSSIFSGFYEKKYQRVGYLASALVQFYLLSLMIPRHLGQHFYLWVPGALLLLLRMQQWVQKSPESTSIEREKE